MEEHQKRKPKGEITQIYLVKNCYNDPNKVYIGKSCGSRKSPHKKTFGTNIVYTYIDSINSLDKKDWKPLESYWIEQFRQWGFEVQNKNEGGGGPPKGRKLRPKDKIWKKNIGIANSKPKPNYFRNIASEKKKGKPSSFLGHHHSIESKDKISRAKIGKSSKKKDQCILYPFKNEIIEKYKTLNIKQLSENFNVGEVTMWRFLKKIDSYKFQRKRYDRKKKT